MRAPRLQALRERLSTSLWVFPVLAVLLAVGLAKALVAVDELLARDSQAWYLYAGQADSARELLSTIASSLLTFTGLVFSITILVLQLASSQFSPRVLRTFLRDRITQLTMATLVGSFVFAMVVLPEVRSSAQPEDAFVPSLSVFVAFLLVLLSVGLFIRYIHHMGHSIRAVNIIYVVAKETQGNLERMYPEELAEEPAGEAPRPPLRPPSLQVSNERPGGVVSAVNEERLLKLACSRELIIEFLHQMGDFVPRGAPLFHVWGVSPMKPEELTGTVVLGRERSPQQDPAFGFRQLVDIAERALSPGINDPSTAVQALDQLHDLLRTLAGRAFPSPARVDDEGALRLVLPRPDWDGYVRLALDEIRQYGEGSLQISRRLREVLLDLLSITRGARKDILREQLMLLDAATDRGFETEMERRIAHEPSPQGHGTA